MEAETAARDLREPVAKVVQAPDSSLPLPGSRKALYAPDSKPLEHRVEILLAPQADRPARVRLRQLRVTLGATPSQEALEEALEAGLLLLLLRNLAAPAAPSAMPQRSMEGEPEPLELPDLSELELMLQVLAGAGVDHPSRPMPELEVMRLSAAAVVVAVSH